MPKILYSDEPDSEGEEDEFCDQIDNKIEEKVEEEISIIQEEKPQTNLPKLANKKNKIAEKWDELIDDKLKERKRATVSEFKCEKCNKMFKRQHNLNKHIAELRCRDGRLELEKKALELEEKAKELERIKQEAELKKIRQEKKRVYNQKYAEKRPNLRLYKSQLKNQRLNQRLNQHQFKTLNRDI